MSWGDVWVCDATERPAIDPSKPQAPWVKVGVITREERNFIDGMQQLRGTRKSQARAIDFFLQVHTRDVVLDRADAKPGVLSFNPSGLWMAVDVTAPGGEVPRFVGATQRVHSVPFKRTPAKPPGGRRPVATFALRAKSKGLGASPLEWLRASGAEDTGD